MKNTFSNSGMLNWLGFFANKMDVSPEKIKMLNICGRQKNVVPTIDTHKRVLIYTDASHKETIVIDAEVGDMVEVTAGAWEGTVGSIKAINPSKQTITIDVEIFGRATSVEIAFADIKKL